MARLTAGMMLTNPAGLALLVLLGPLFALYVLRAKRRRRIVPSVFLWREAPHELRAARRLRRLVPMVPLFIEALTIVALAVAAAGPTARGSLATADAVAIVFDTSASMGARDRLARAKEAAKRLVRSLARRGVLVVEAAKEARLVTGLERDPVRLERIVDAFTVRAEPSDLARAAALAEQRLAGLPGTHRLVIVTDVNGTVPARSRFPLEVIRVGAPEDNIAITRFELRRTSPPLESRDRVDALVVVQSFASARTERFVSLVRRGTDKPFASRRVALAPHERRSVTLSFEAGDDDSGAGVVAELSPADALVTDDRAFGSVPPGPRLPVVVAPRGKDPWLVRAFAADAGVDLREADLPFAPGSVARGALVVVHGACVDPGTGADVLFVAPPAGDCLGTRIGDPLRAPVITSWSDRDPRLRFVSLDDVHPLEARAVDAPRGAALVRARDATLVADLGFSGRTGTVVSFDWTRSDWPLRASFVLFVRNVTEVARADRARAFGAAARTGEPLRIAAPAMAGGMAVVRGPEGELPVRIASGALMAEAPSVPGFYDVLSRGKTVASIAVNPGDYAESDLGKTNDVTAEAPDRRAPAVSTALSPWSSYFAFVALIGVATEAFWLFRSRAGQRGSHHVKRRPAALMTICVVTSIAAVFAQFSERAAVRFVLFERPAWLLAGAAVTFLLVLFAVLRRERRAPLAETLLAVVAVTAALGAARPVLRRGDDRLAVILAVDRSRSIDLVPGAPRRIDRALAEAERGMKGSDLIGVVAFASEAALEEPLRGASGPRSPERAALGRDGTDLGAGIERALAEVPADAAARIVLVSDGVATRGDTLGAAARAALAGVPVDVLPLTQAPVPNVRVESVRAPPHAASGETIDLRVTVRAPADGAAEMVVLADGEAVQRGRVTLHEGEDMLFVRARAASPGLHEYTVRVHPADPKMDAVAEDDSRAAFVRVSGPARAVIIEEEDGRAGPIEEALEAAAFDVQVESPTRAPVDAAALLQDDLIVLGDVPARDLSPEQLERMRSYVEHLGGGMLLVGGKRAMGPGGYAGTPIEKVSPVTFELRNERRRARLAEVIAIDYSGSMEMTQGTHTKLELANEAAVRSADLLGAIDRLGVLHVDTTATWTVPLGPVGDKTDIARRVRAVGTGGGGIYVDQALEVAYAALDREQVEQKHVLLFADGDDAEERRAAPSLARAARSRGITTSVVALGRGQDIAGLEHLSRDGDGRFYLVEDATRLPSVFAEETTIAAGSAVREDPFRAVPGVAIAASRGIDFSRAPLLGGYTVTTAKPRAEVALLATDGNPLLAVWAAGTGHAAAFTSDYAGPWGEGWRAWPDAARLFGQLAKSLARGGDDPDVTLDAIASEGSLRLSATALSPDGSFDADRALSATVLGPDGFVRTARLEPTSPGAYEALVPLAHAGTYVADVRDDATGAAVGTAGAALSSGDEVEPTGSDRPLLERIAKISGGKVRASLADVFADRPESRRSSRDIAALLAELAALAMLLSAAARRLPAPDLARRLAPVLASARSIRLRGASPREPAAPLAEARVPVTEPDGAPRATPKSAGPSPEAEAPKATAEILLSRRNRRR